jgi:hypothetical protein
MFGQNTFSRVYDLDEEVLRNGIEDFEILDGFIYTYSSHACLLGDNNYRTCVGLTKYNMQGDTVKTILLDTLDATECCTEGLTTDGESILISTYLWGEFNIIDEYDKITVIDFDSNLDQLNVHKYSEEPFTNSGLINSGIEIIGGKRYIYGSINNPSGIPDSVHIIKTDLEGNELDRFYYSYGNSSLDINNLQATPDGNLAFILQIESPAGANNGFDGYQLMKVDTLGIVLDTFTFEDNGQQPNRILSSSDGSYYFSSLEHPFDGWDPFSYGMINKLNANMDTLEWSLILPNDQLVDGRHYRMYDYIEVSNGDIVACGMAYDNTDTELDTGVPDKNSTWNGFIVRMSTDGEIIWLRLYKNDNDLLPHNEYGRFRPGLLKDIKELPDGRFIAAGNVFVNTTQNFAIDQFETEAFHLWLLVVDENGCLEEFDCEEIIRINQTDDLSYSIGDEWVYEQEDFIGGGNTNIDFKSFFIEDTLFDGIRTKYILDVHDTFYVENSKMYFWDEYYQDYIMYFDFDETESYDIKYYDQFMDSEEIATVVIDSISYLNFGNDSLQVQHVHILNSGTLEDYTDVVYEGIGAGYFGIKFLLGCGLCDDNPYTTKLRCFINDTMTYQFVQYACDSIWLITSTHEIDKEKLKLYPNPTSEMVYIDGINTEVEYQLYSLGGQIIKQGKTINRTVNIDNNGFYILKIKVDGKWIIKKGVKIE